MAESELSKRLRKMTARLIDSLTAVNSKRIANIMYSDGHLNRVEAGEVKACKTDFDAATALLGHVETKEDPTIKNFAKALRDVEMFTLAQELDPPAAENTASGTTAAKENGNATCTTDVLENLRLNAKNIAERLTLGETDTIIATLRSSRENHLSNQDYEDLKGISGDTRRAAALIDIVLRKQDKNLVNYFAKILLEEVHRKDLCTMILGGGVTGK